jgi:hypothetical protein
MSELMRVSERRSHSICTHWGENGGHVRSSWKGIGELGAGPTPAAMAQCRLSLPYKNFIQMTERTKAHEYPREEIHAMMNFYGGKTCVITHEPYNIDWAHMLNSALPSSNERVWHPFHLQLSSMLTPKMQPISLNGC